MRPNGLRRRGRQGKYSTDGRLAQLVRASRLHREGRRFESVTAYHSPEYQLHFDAPGSATARLRPSRPPDRRRQDTSRAAFPAERSPKRKRRPFRRRSRSFYRFVQCAVRPPAASSASGFAKALTSSSQTIGVGTRTSALASTSSIRATGMISMPPLMASEISVRSLALSSGMKTVLMPPRAAASSFSFRPPIGSTRPRNVISPVIATSCRIGMPVSTETIDVVIATPADGPSFGVAPSGTCTWMSRRSNNGGSMP